MVSERLHSNPIFISGSVKNIKKYEQRGSHFGNQIWLQKCGLFLFLHNVHLKISGAKLWPI
jgi:hypothetical protein